MAGPRSEGSNAPAPAMEPAGEGQAGGVHARSCGLATAWRRFATGPFRRPLAILAAFLLLLTAGRTALLLFHADDFRSLGGLAMTRAFARGLWFDASITFRAVGVPLLLLMLPFGWARSRWWQGIWSWLSFAVFLFFGALVAIDLVYFGYVHRHLGVELSYLTWDEARTYAFGNHAGPAAAAFVAGVGTVFGWRKLLGPPPAMPARRLPHLALCGVAILSMAFVARGGVARRKSLHVTDAFEGVTSPSEGFLTLNAPFSALTTWSSIFRRDRYLYRTEFYEWPRALESTRALSFGPADRVESEEYPLLRRGREGSGEKKNVMIVMLESWDGEYVDAVRRARGEEPLGATPEFDLLCREGVLFPNFYAPGQRSLTGLYAMAAGLPTLPGMPFLGAGLEQMNVPFLPRVASRAGYSTTFVQGTGRHYQRVHSAASLVGFETVQDGEDIPILDDDLARPQGEGLAWDHELFAHAQDVFASAPRPFFGLVFSSSTHEPYNWPEEKWKKFPPDGEVNSFLNSLYYSDAALGDFVRGAREAGWFDDTIWLFMGDHTSGRKFDPADPSSLFHVPCLIVAPGLEPGVDDSVGSQLDVMPTLLDLAGLAGPQAGIGRSLFDPTLGPDHGAFAAWGPVILRIEAGGVVMHNLQDRVGSMTFREDADLDAIEFRLLSTLQVVYTLYRKNRFSPME